MAETRNTYLYCQTVEKIKKMLLRKPFREGDKVPSERLLAEQLGVAYVTVRKAMEILVEEGVILKKPRAAAVLRHLPENSDMALRQIGLTVWAGAEINHPGTLKMLDAAYNVFSPDKYKIIIIFITPDMVKNNKWDVLLDRSDLDGIIVRVQEIPHPVLEALRVGKTPAVFIDFPGFSPGATGEGGTAFRKLADYLTSIGHRKIAFMGGPSDLFSSQIYKRAYYEFLDAEKLQYSKFINTDYSETAAYSGALELFRSPDAPTAVIAGDDFMAVGILKALKELGLRCPEDVSVCSFGGYYVSEQSNPQITVCRSGRPNPETAASEMLKELLETGKNITQNFIVNSEIVIRESTGKSP